MREFVNSYPIYKFHYFKKWTSINILSWINLITKSMKSGIQRIIINPRKYISAFLLLQFFSLASFYYNTCNYILKNNIWTIVAHLAQICVLIKTYALDL